MIFSLRSTTSWSLNLTTMQSLLSIPSPFSRLGVKTYATEDIDAIAWLLTTTPPLHPATLFNKGSQMTGFDSIGRHYRPRLLEFLMPLLTLLITSYHPPEHQIFDTRSPSSNLGRTLSFKVELKREQFDVVLNDVLKVCWPSLSLVDNLMGSIDKDLHLKNIYSLSGTMVGIHRLWFRVPAGGSDVSPRSLNNHLLINWNWRVRAYPRHHL